MLRFCSLGSGSSGNGTVIEGTRGSSTRRLLVDCGFGPRQLAQRLARVGLASSDIDAVFVTHEHSDHIGCAVNFALRHGAPLWMSQGTYTAIGSPALGPLLHLVRDGDAMDLGTFEARPFTVPHDAREPLQLRCSDGDRLFGMATDLGHATPHVLAQLSGCHALILEANHDSEMLERSAYPHFLKRRVGGDWGHLSNSASVGILRTVAHEGLTSVVAAHLSERNNCRELVQTMFAQTLGWDIHSVVVADPVLGTAWIGVGD